MTNIPKFPTMLRKMWTGQEVQEWIDQSIKPSMEESDRGLTAFRAVLNYVLGEGRTEDPLEFLRCWSEGNFDALRKEWPDAPEEIYFADPLAARTPKAEPAVGPTWLTSSEPTPERQFAEWLNSVRGQVVSSVFHEIMQRYAQKVAPAPNALDAETAIKNCLETGETMRVLKRVVNLLLESRRNLGPEDHELRDRIDQLFLHDAAIAAQAAQGAKS